MDCKFCYLAAAQLYPVYTMRWNFLYIILYVLTYILKCILFLWNQIEGGLTSNDFESIILHFVLSQFPLPQGKDKILLDSDRCGY